MLICYMRVFFFFFKQKTAYELRISDWSSDVCSSDLLEDTDLPAGEVLVRVGYSDLNYKDGLIVNGLARLVRSYPHIPGIDLAGTEIGRASCRERVCQYV